MHADCDCVGIDWGTTHRRLYALGSRGEALRTLEDDDGVSSCRGRFEESLARGLQQLEVTPRRVVMSGMVGSAMGWQLVPYVDASVALSDLPKRLVSLKTSTGKSPAWVVPGYCVRDAQGNPDVMRGEETQLLGAWAMGYTNGLFVLPGTHSKWVEVVNGKIVQLRTYMTGELFSLLCSHGTLAAAAAGSEQQWDNAVFDQGVLAGRQGDLTGQLFGARARVVCSDMEACHVHASISGLLIGSEFKDALNKVGARHPSEPIRVLGASSLARHYEQAARLLGRAVEILEPNAAYVRGIAYIQQHGDF